MKTLALLGSVLGLLTLAQTAIAQGTIVFGNSGTTLITNCHTRLPQAPRTIKLGLYFTPDLSAATNAAALASLVLVHVATNGPTSGRFYSGMVFLPGVPIESYVVLQIKAWPLEFPSYEAAVAAGAEVAQSLPWVQKVGGSTFPPTIIWRWGFSPFVYPQCDPIRVPLALERSGNTLRVVWPVGVPPNVQVNDGTSTNWQALTSGTFVTDHWEFQLPPTGGVQLFRLGN